MPGRAQRVRHAAREELREPLLEYGQVAPEDVDNHPNGDPKGRDPCKLVERLRKKRVDLHAFRIEPSTDRMWAALKSAYDKASASGKNKWELRTHEASRGATRARHTFCTLR